MQKKSIAMMSIIGCTAILLTGCIKQEEYDSALATITEREAQIEAQKAVTAEREVELAKKTAEVNTLTGLKEAVERDIKKKDGEIADLRRSLSDEQGKVSDLEADVSREKSKVSRANDSISSLQDELAELQDAYKKLQANWTQLENNLKMLDKKVPEKGDMKAAEVSDAPFAEIVPAKDDKKLLRTQLTEMQEMNK